MRLTRRDDGFYGDLYIARGAVLKANRARQSGRKLAVDLAFCSARADGSPAYKLGHILRRDHVKKFGPGGHAHLGQIEQQVPRHSQTIVDTKRLIEVWIVDQALPSQCRAR